MYAAQYDTIDARCTVSSPMVHATQYIYN
jgi:hypothetical protein